MDRGLAVQKMIDIYRAVLVKILYLTDLEQKLLSLRDSSYLCTHLAVSAQG